MSYPFLLPVATREAIENQIEALIAFLDALDGDPDNEDSDPAGQCDEDGVNTGSRAFYLHSASHSGPGCPISDVDERSAQPAAIPSN